MFIKKDSIFVSSTYLLKIMHSDLYSFLSITLSCKDFLYILSKDLIVCWSVSYSLLLFLYLLHVISKVSYVMFFLPNDRVQAIRADIVKIIKPIPVIERVIEFDVGPIITIVSTDSNFVLRVLQFF